MGLGQEWRDIWVYRTGLEGSMDVGQDKRDIIIVQDWRDLWF